jgi:phosphoglycolate phosphatase
LSAPLSPAARRFPALVFDLDGTLIDSAGEIAVAVNALLAEAERPGLPPEMVRGFIGEGAQRLVARSFAATGPALEEADLAEATRRYQVIYEGLAGGDVDQLFPAVRETLEELARAGHRLGLCTNKPQRATEKLLRILSLSHLFGAVAGGDTLAARKPDPAPLRWVMERLGEAAGVMVGDSGIDVGAARNAGLPVILLSWGYPRQPPAELGADLLIDRISELPAALDRLAG